MRQAIILYKNEKAGVLTQFDNGSFEFRYDDSWFYAEEKPPIHAKVSR